MAGLFRRPPEPQQRPRRITAEGPTATEVNPGLIDNSGVIFAPSVNQSVQVPLIGGNSAFQADAFQADAFQTDSTVIFAPTFSFGGNTVSPPLIDQTGVLFGPSINQSVSPGLIDQSGITFAPQINQSVTPSLIDQSGVVFSPAIAGGGQTVSPPLIGGGTGGAFQADAFQNDAFQVDTTTTVVFSPTITTAGGGQSVTPPLIDQSGVLFSPQVNQQVNPGLIDQSGVLFAPTIQNPQTVSPGLIDQSAVIFSPVISTGVQTVTIPLIDQSGVLFGPSVTLSVQPGLIASTRAIYAPTFGREPSPPLIESNVRLFIPDISQPGANVPGGPAATNVQLFYNGVDIWPDVVRQNARFTSMVNGQAGTCLVRVKDPLLNKSFTIGKRLRLRINGRWHWSGFVRKQNYVYGFDYNVARPTTRFIELEGVDINILFDKRVTYRRSAPAKLEGPTYGDFTSDAAVIEDLIDDWLDLSGDAIDTHTLVDSVGTINEDERATPFGGSWTWGQAMQAIARLPAALYYIDADQKLVYADVDTPSVPYIFTDQPHTTTSGIGYRESVYINDGGELINDAFVWGVSGGSPRPVISRLQSTASIAAHGRWQYAEVNGAVYKQSTVDRITDSIVNGSPQSKRGHKNDKTKVDLTTYEDRIRTSDRVRFVSSVYGIDEVFPVRSAIVDFPVGEPRFRMTLSHDIDAPWSFYDNIFYSFLFPPIGGVPPFDPDFPDIDWTDPEDPECVVIDDFQRNVSPDSWGTATIGAAWTLGFDGGIAQVDGTNGQLVNLNPIDTSERRTFQLIKTGLEAGTTFDGDVIDYSLRFKPSRIPLGIERPPGEVDDGFFDFVVEFTTDRAPAAATVDLRIHSNPDGNGGLGSQLAGISMAGDFVEKTNWQANVWHTLKFQIERTSATTSQQRAKVWWDGESEPGWQVGTTGSWADVPANELFLLMDLEYNSFNADSSVAYTWYFDDITTCGTGGQAVGSALYRDQCETLTTTGAQTIFTTTHPYLHGQLFVYLNGEFQEPGIEWNEMSPTEGVFGMTVAPGALDVLRVCYTPTSDTGGMRRGGP